MRPVVIYSLGSNLSSTDVNQWNTPFFRLSSMQVPHLHISSSMSISTNPNPQHDVWCHVCPRLQSLQLLQACSINSDWWKLPSLLNGSSAASTLLQCLSSMFIRYNPNSKGFGIWWEKGCLCSDEYLYVQHSDPGHAKQPVFEI